jgi:glycosyltransferase involved in cell wall biosynthesis
VLVTVVTPAIPERLTTFLPEALASVAAQTIRPQAHLVGVDIHHRGNSHILNQLVATVTTEWVVLLADDDVLYPTHLERCLSVSDDADVVYPYADLSMWPGNAGQRTLINAPWNPERIKRKNWIPGGCALIRTEMWHRVGGVSTDPHHAHIHDWIMWRDIAEAGGRFVCLPEELWLYRYHPGQMEARVDGRN